MSYKGSFSNKVWIDYKHEDSPSQDESPGPSTDRNVGFVKNNLHETFNVLDDSMDKTHSLQGSQDGRVEAEVELESQFQCNNMSEPSNTFSVTSSEEINSWPNLIEAQKLNFLKLSPYESYSQKLQSNGKGKNILNRSSSNKQPCKSLQIHQKGMIQTTNKFSLKSVWPTPEPYLKTAESEGAPIVSNSCLPPVSLVPQTNATFLSERNFISGSNGESSCSQTKQMQKSKEKKSPVSETSRDTLLNLILRSPEDRLVDVNSVKQDVQCRQFSLSKDFPDLPSAQNQWSKCTLKRKGSQEANQCKDDSSKVLFDQKSKKRQPRRKDPISVNIIEILKDFSETSKHSESKILKCKIKELERRKLGGNLLDSSNPIRKRGKQSEKPKKKKLSKLKLVILNERQKKQEQRRFATEFLSKPMAVSDISNVVTGSNVQTICNDLESMKIQEQNLLQSEEIDTPFNSEVVSQISTLATVKLEESIISGDVSQNDKQLHYTDHFNCPLNNTPEILHSRKFREYCDNMRSQILDDAVANLLKEICRFQDRNYHRDPMKAHAKRRFVLGMREVNKYLLLKKLRAIVIAPDLEPVKSSGGIDDTIIQLKEEGRMQQIPVIFAIGRRQLGFTLKKKVPISVVGVINYEGAEAQYRAVVEAWTTASKEYRDRVMELSSFPASN